MSETLERRGLWMLHVGDEGRGPGGDKHDSEILSLGK